MELQEVELLHDYFQECYIASYCCINYWLRPAIQIYKLIPDPNLATIIFPFS